MSTPRVVVAPDKFKGSLAAGEVAEAIAAGLRGSGVDAVEHPVADGGEGTVATALAHGFVPVDAVVDGPLGDPVTARFAVSADGHTAVVEMAAAAGLALVAGGPSATAAWSASTYGVGRLLAAAAGTGVRRIVVGLGGSATTDGGAGAVHGIGARVVTASGGPVASGARGLLDVAGLELDGLDPRLAAVDVRLACDVDNPLTGAHGAAVVYGPQKGLPVADVAAADEALDRWADVVAARVGSDLRQLPGTGAAGGLAFGLAAVLGAEITSGIDLMLELTGFDAAVAGADLVVVGEGSLDGQSLHGKGPVGVARAARRLGVPVVAVVGRSLVTPAEAAAAGIGRVHALTSLEPDPDRSMRNAAALLRDVGELVAGALASPRGAAP